MATCTRCGNRKLRKRTDGWYHCKRHGPTRKINTPQELRKVHTMTEYQETIETDAVPTPEAVEQVVAQDTPSEQPAEAPTHFKIEGDAVAEISAIADELDAKNASLTAEFEAFKVRAQDEINEIRERLTVEVRKHTHPTVSTETHSIDLRFKGIGLVLVSEDPSDHLANLAGLNRPR